MRWAVCMVVMGMLLTACTRTSQITDQPSPLLRFSDGRADLSSLPEINRVLRPVGVRLETVELPPSAQSLLASSAVAPLTPKEREEVLRLFAVSREEMIALTRATGREPVLDGGGSMSTGEVGVPPYPKVYDLKSMGPKDRLAARDKFGRLHVNSADDGTGVDEVMTLVAGGPWKWYFLIEGDVVVELQMSRVDTGGPGWRLIYPGLTPHGGHFYAEDGLCVAYITGPAVWKMRYEAPGIAGSGMLGKNPWIDFEAK